MIFLMKWHNNDRGDSLWDRFGDHKFFRMLAKCKKKRTLPQKIQTHCPMLRSGRVVQLQDQNGSKALTVWRYRFPVLMQSKKWLVLSYIFKASEIVLLFFLTRLPRKRQLPKQFRIGRCEEKHEKISWQGSHTSAHHLAQQGNYN